MGTAGPLALARDKLIDSKRSPFFVLNADGACCLAGRAFEIPLRPGAGRQLTRPLPPLPSPAVTCTYPLKDLMAFHIERKAEATIFVTKVEEPSKYGVVVFDEASGKARDPAAPPAPARDAQGPRPHPGASRPLPRRWTASSRSPRRSSGTRSTPACTCSAAACST